jgi:hypothetical protein
MPGVPFLIRTNTTDLNVSQQSPPVYTGGGETDTIYQVRTIPPKGDGFMWCDKPITQPLCDQAYVAFGSNAVATVALACHETGHAVGLLHGAQSVPALAGGNEDPSLYCMRKSAPTTLVGPHNVAHINVTY